MVSKKTEKRIAKSLKEIEDGKFDLIDFSKDRNAFKKLLKRTAIKIRKAAKKDIESLLPLFKDYLKFYEVKDPNVNKAKKFLENHFNNKSSVIFIATDESQTAGFAQLYPMWSSVSMGKVWILNDLYVDKNYRNLGIAKLLLEEIGLFAKETNADQIRLETGKDNLAAQQLYNSIGYLKEQKHVAYYYNLN